MEESLSVAKLVGQVYAPSHRHGNWRLEELVGHSRVRYVRLGRHALFRALDGVGVRKGDAVLLPGFICKELLSAVHALEAVPVFYGVGQHLGISDPVDGLPPTKAILAINFFGFPQDLGPFRRYCERTGAFLIEDNAHGLFGQDDAGIVLGARGDAGIFSMRKSLDMHEGAALVINDPQLASRFDLSTEYSEPGRARDGAVKRMFRTSVGLFGIWPVRSFILANRLLRYLRTGEVVPSSPVESEFVLPQGDAAPPDLPESLGNIDVEGEIARRRRLYLWLDEALKRFQVQAVFDRLPEKVVPYCYPMILNEEQVPAIRKWLGAHGLDCFQWPDLPAREGAVIPAWYRQVWSVPFKW